jgi:hypothetical protein
MAEYRTSAPAVIVSSSLMAPGFPDYGAIAAQLEVDTVLVDNRHGAHAAVQHLIGYGHRRIGYWATARTSGRCGNALVTMGVIDGDTSPPRGVLLLTRLIARGSGEIAPTVT